VIYFSPRGVARHRWDQSERKQIQNRRRFYLLGETLDAAQVWDTVRAIQVVDNDKNLANASLAIAASKELAGVALYASLFRRDIEMLELHNLSSSHRNGPNFLNVERYLDIPQALAMAAERSKIFLNQDDDTGWEYPQSVAKALNWPENQIQIRRKPADK